MIDHPYRPMIEDACRYAGSTVPPDVLEAMVYVESKFKPDARSRSNAIGLGQLIYKWHSSLVVSVARDLDATVTGEAALYNPRINLYAAARHLAWCYQECGTWESAVAKYHSGQCVPPSGFTDGQDTTTVRHVEKFRAAIASLRGSDAAQEQEQTDMATTYTTNIPGLPGGPLETSFPIRVNLVSSSMTRNRPGIKLRGPFETTQHNTSNWGTLAPAEASYLRNGAGGRQASWHVTIDAWVGEITIPFDEVAWHAGDGSGPGNMSTVACELTMKQSMVENPTDWRRARSNAAEIMGKTAARKGGPPPGRYHNAWSGKDCPILLRNNAAWDREYQADYAHFYAMEREAMAGTTPKPEPEPVDTIINIGDTIRALAPLNLRQTASTAAPIIVTLETGAEMVVNGRWASADGYGWLPVATGAGNGAVAMGDENGPYIEKVKNAPPKAPEPIYVDAVPIPALLDTDLSKYDTAEGITTDEKEQDFVFVADVIEFTEVTVAGEFAIENPRAVKKPYQIGDRAIAAWLVKAAHGPWFYVLAGPGDEWIRVRYDQTRRISDAPLLGNEWGEDEEVDISALIEVLNDTLGNT